MRREALAVAAIIAASVTTEAAAENIGSAVKVVNKVTAAAQQTTRALATGSPVNQNEFIEVAADALGELRLKDDTKLALGPGARLKLDKFVYDPARTSGTIAVDLAKGAFRFVTGNARKPSYLIRSPNASISVRGTVFDVYVDQAGNMWVLLHEGSLEVCNASGQCRTLDGICHVVRVGAGGIISESTTLDRQPNAREINFATAFPFVVSPPSIDPVPRFPRAEIENGSCAGNGGPLPPTQQRTEAPGPLGPPAPTPPAMPPQQRAEPGQPMPSAPTAPAPPMPPQYEAAPRKPASPMPRADLPAPAHDPIVEDHPDEPLYDEPMPRGPSKPRPRPHTAGAPLYEPPHVPALETDAPPITIPRWSGFYIGLTGGGGGMSREVQVDCVDLGATITVPSLYIPRDCHYASARGLRTQTFAPEAAGLTTGASLGFNMQLGSLVTGLEADFAVSSVSGTGRTAMHVSADDENATVTHELNWLSTFRGRIGYAYGSWLLYATGGLAVGEADMSYAMTVPRFGDYASVTHTETKVGWTMGAGAEYSFGMFSIRGEVLHFDLGEEVLSAKGYFAGGGRSATTLKPEFETRGNIGRVGVSFHLD